MESYKMGKVYCANNNKKKAGVTIRIDFKTKIFTGNKEEHS